MNKPATISSGGGKNATAQNRPIREYLRYTLGQHLRFGGNEFGRYRLGGEAQYKEASGTPYNPTAKPVGAPGRVAKPANIFT